MRGLLIIACLLSVASAHDADATVVFALDHITPSVYFDARNDCTRIFSRAGIRLKWIEREKEDYPEMVLVRVRVASGPGPVHIQPSALAYAKPFNDQPTIVVLYDRLRVIVASRPRLLSHLLAHVLAHEIGHILQRTDQHAVSGVMKARWNGEDYDSMAGSKLAFTRFDIELMQEELASWRKRAAIH